MSHPSFPFISGAYRGCENQEQDAGKEHPGIVQPEQEFKKALEEYSGKLVEVTSVTDQSTEFQIFGFARVEDLDDRIVYRTPELKFADSKQIVNRYWFHRLLKVDLSLAVTTVTFPDGHVETFYEEQKIPRVTHEIMR